MLPQEKIMEIIYYMIDKAIDGTNNSVSVNFYADNVEVSMYPMGNGKED